MRQSLAGLIVMAAASTTAMYAIVAVCVSSTASAEPQTFEKKAPAISLAPELGSSPRSGRSDARDLLRHASSSPARQNASTNRGADRLVAQAIKAEDHGNPKKARALVRRALAMAPNHPGAHLLKGAIAQMDGDPQTARAEYERYLQLEPDGDYAEELRALLPKLAGQ